MIYQRIGRTGHALEKIIQKDQFGRVVEVVARVHPENIGTGTDVTKAAKAWVTEVAGDKYDAGHIIGKILGGRGGLRIRVNGKWAKFNNVFPANPHMNQVDMGRWEQLIANRIRASGQYADIRIRLVYDSTASWATKVIHGFRMEGAEAFLERTFVNGP